MRSLFKRDTATHGSLCREAEAPVIENLTKKSRLDLLVEISTNLIGFEYGRQRTSSRSY
jgi:hypothetical protein